MRIALVDPERARLRLQRLDEAVQALEAVRAAGWDAYAASRERRRATERDLQEAEQVVADLCAEALAARGERPPDGYAALPHGLARAGLLDAGLASELADALRQRNLLVHFYLDVDDRKVFATLDHLPAFRRFAAVMARVLDDD